MDFLTPVLATIATLAVIAIAYYMYRYKKLSEEYSRTVSQFQQALRELLGHFDLFIVTDFENIVVLTDAFVSRLGIRGLSPLSPDRRETVEIKVGRSEYPLTDYILTMRGTYPARGRPFHVGFVVADIKVEGNRLVISPALRATDIPVIKQGLITLVKTVGERAVSEAREMLDSLRETLNVVFSVKKAVRESDLREMARLVGAFAYIDDKVVEWIAEGYMAISKTPLQKETLLAKLSELSETAYEKIKDSVVSKVISAIREVFSEKKTPSQQEVIDAIREAVEAL